MERNTTLWVPWCKCCGPLLSKFVARIAPFTSSTINFDIFPNFSKDNLDTSTYLLIISS